MAQGIPPNTYGHHSCRWSPLIITGYHWVWLAVMMAGAHRHRRVPQPYDSCSNMDMDIAPHLLRLLTLSRSPGQPLPPFPQPLLLVSLQLEPPARGSGNTHIPSHSCSHHTPHTTSQPASCDKVCAVHTSVHTGHKDGQYHMTHYMQLAYC